MTNLIILACIVGYIAYVIQNLGNREQRLIEEHKQRMRAENELEIARYAEATGSIASS